MGEIIFLWNLAILTFGYCLTNFIRFFLKRNRTVQTVGTVISIKSPNPSDSMFHNSKWARISYKANGKYYESENRIQVPAASQIGTKISVYYDRKNPEKLYRFSTVRIVISFLIAAVSAVLAAAGSI